MNLTGHLLLAMPAMSDPHFAGTVTFMCEHNEQGALGVVVNRPIDMTLQTLLKQIEIECASGKPAETLIHYGGPVQIDRGFVLHQPTGEWQSTLKIGEDLGLTTSKDILEAAARGEAPSRMIVTLGYAGWGPGQLEHELSQNAWLTVSAEPRILFDIPAPERYAAGLALLGIDLAMLSGDAGHA